MCRLFGLHAGRTPVDAEFWLLDASDDLEQQSHRNADGFGIWTFDEHGAPVVDKAPRPAWQDTDFATAAHRLHGRTFVAHVRRASTGAPSMLNTHPFLQDRRLFAHNGAVGDLPAIEARLDALGSRSLVHGDTDSERVFALITGETRARDGDLGAGITAAMRWLTEHVPVVSLNFVLISPTDLWAFRAPLEDGLYTLARPAGATAGGPGMSVRGSHLAARAAQLETQPSFVVASEPMDDESAWRLMDDGELLHVGPGPDVASRSTIL